MPNLPDILRFASMAGSSIAAPSASPWVTDFLNAAYYARPQHEREVADLRLAHGILTTHWSELGGRRLAAKDIAALNAAFGKLRVRGHGRLDRTALMSGAAALLGPWFPAAWADDARRADGIAFRSSAEHAASDPERRLRHAALGALTPPTVDPRLQQWSTYEPVRLPDPAAALALLDHPHRWPDIGCAAGRFTALRGGGLLGQTFEIEVVAQPTPRTPICTRGYVTCTNVALRGTVANELDTAVLDLQARYQAGAADSAPALLPDEAETLALIVLTTHAGHFLGPALSQLLVWRDERGVWIRDIGAWDPFPAYLSVAYAAAGRAAQHAFWGPKPPDRSMLAQLAAVSDEPSTRETVFARPANLSPASAMNHDVVMGDELAGTRAETRRIHREDPGKGRRPHRGPDAAAVIKQARQSVPGGSEIRRGQLRAPAARRSRAALGQTQTTRAFEIVAGCA